MRLRLIFIPAATVIILFCYYMAFHKQMNHETKEKKEYPGEESAFEVERDYFEKIC